MPPMPPGGGAGGPTPQSGALQTIMGALANRTGAGGAGGGAGKDLSQQMGELQGADPGMILQQLESVKQVLGIAFIKTFQTLPKVAAEIAAAMKQMDKAIKAAQEGAQVGEVIGKGPDASGGGPQPIGFSAAQSGNNAPGAQPVT